MLADAGDRVEVGDLESRAGQAKEAVAHGVRGAGRAGGGVPGRGARAEVEHALALRAERDVQGEPVGPGVVEVGVALSKSSSVS